MVVDSLFENNTAATYAGAVEVYGNSNTAVGGNTGAVSADADVAVINSLFQGNTSAADYGGAMDVVGSLTITNTRFINNKAATDGGALYVWGNGNIQAVNSLFAGNSAGFGNGAAVYMDSTGGDNTIQYTTIASATLGSGSAVEVAGGTLAITCYSISIRMRFP